MAEPIYRLETVCYSYDEKEVLHKLNLSLQPGRFYGLIGPNGCGKTTLLDLLVGSRLPSSGKILYQQQPLKAISRKKLAKEVALVPQEFDTGFGFTVEEIVMMGRNPHIPRFSPPAEKDWSMVNQALESIGIRELRARPVSSLSGGQKQRAIVARALAQDTRVLLLDEATANLDIKYSLQIFARAKAEVAEHNKTIVAVIHDLNFAAAYCDELIFLKNGHIYCQGPTGQTMTEENVAAVFGIATKISWNTFSKALQLNYRYQQGR